jgi:tetratricopeptide (TPR) repeat protein
MLVQRFEKEHRNSPLDLHEEILLGRVLNAKAAALLKQSTGSKPGGGPDGNQHRRQADELRRTAIEHLEKVLAESRLPRTLALARFHLGRILQDAGQHARAVEVLAPLVKQAEQPQASSEAVESLVISAHSQSELGNQEAAVAAFSKYLALRPKGDQAEQALADRALANARLGKTQAAGADALLLLKAFPQSSVGADTLRRLAERAYDAKEWTGAAELFQMMVERGSAESDLRRIGLSGLGWAKFQLKAYDESAAAFEQVFDRFSARHPQVAEAGYMRGRALQEAGKRSEAAKAYADAFQKLAPPTPAEPGAETAGPTQYGFLAGVQAANLLAQLKRYDESDTAYRLVIERFPKARQDGQVLFDWANMLYVARKEPEQRGRVREILARIVRDFPESSAQNNARLFLAELDLLDGKVTVAEKAFRDVLADPKADAKVREDGLSRLIAVAADKEEWTSVQNLAGKFLAQFPASPDIRLVRLNLAASQLGLKDPAAAEQTLVKLQREISDAGGETPDWSARVWVLLAEAYYQEKKYDDVQATVEDLRHRMPKSTLLYQADEILGRSFKNQAQWDKAIAAFQRVIDDRQGAQNETAAKSQLMIAECWYLQKNYRQAREDYLKVSTLYDKLPEWAAPALFQVGQCEEDLKQPHDAEKTYHDLIASFPRSNYAEKAKKRLDDLHKRPAG